MMQRGQKRKQDEEEALNKALRTFEDDFGGLVKPPVGKAFVRGDVVENNKTISAASGKIYQPDAKFSLKLGGSLPSTASNFEEAKKLAAEKARKFLIEAHKGSGPAPTVVVPTTAKPIAKPARPGASKAVKSKTTNLDAFKEELKRVQEERDKRKGLREHLKNELGVDQAAIDKIAPVLDKPYAGNGEFDDDPYTTNLYICNLPQDVVMEDILDTFGSFGPLASAKILYPRTDEEKRREHLCGFVAYMCRQDADRAIASLQHALEINGELVKISFARPVVIPPQPFYVPPGLQALTVPDDYTGLPFNAKPITEDVENWRKRFGDLPVLSSALPQDWSDEQLTTYNQMIKNATIRVVIPTDSSLLHIIHRTIEFVIREGPIFEAMLMGRENQNPVYRFLFETHHPAHVYYRWKLYTILQGERLDTWRMGKYRMFENGSWWEPPPPACELLASMPKSLYYLACNNMNPERWFPTLTQKKEARESRFIREKKEMIARVEQERKKKTALNKIDFKELDTILRQLTPEKDKIGDAMLWCAEHASCAQEVVETIYESLTLNETPLHKKIARLYLIVDVLANCAQRGVKDMFFYRQYFQEFLTKIFSALGDTLKNIEGRLKAEQFKTRVMECFRVWEETALYPREILIHNQNIFLGLVVQREKEASPSSEEEDIDGAPIDEDDIDGVPLDESIYEDIKEDYAPEPPKKKAAFKPTSWDEVKPSQELSKWEMNEEPTSASASREQGGKKENEKPPAKMDDSHRAASDSDGEIDSPNALRANAAFEEERRKLLREVEVKALTYQDDLQADRVPDIKRKVEEYRQKLLSEVTQKLDESMKRERKKDKKRDKKKKESKDDRKDRDRDRDREKRRERDDERDRDRRDREERRDRSRERHRRRSPSRDRGSRRDRSSERRRR